MNYHVRITQRSNRSHDEVKLDLSEEQMRERFLVPYEQGQPIVVNGKTIPAEDIERIRFTKSDVPSSQIIMSIKADDRASPVAFVGGPSYEWQAAGRAEDITDQLILGPPGYKKSPSASPPHEAVSAHTTAGHDDSCSRKKVFIVHGHDHALKSDLEVFLASIGLEPIVLHREEDRGLTVIEKLEHYSDVGYAIILVTPDDFAFSASDAAKLEPERRIEGRARQNVVFEFGYFVGKLRRANVCCLYKEGVELPTDLSGFVYKKVRESIEEVGYSLMKELAAAGLDVLFKAHHTEEPPH